MSPEGQALVESARAVFEHLDGLVGDPRLAAHADNLRRFVFGELGIPIASAVSVEEPEPAPNNLVAIMAKAGPDDAVVHMLRAALEHAQSGRLRAIMLAGQMDDGGLLSVSAGELALFTMLGQLEALKRNVLEQIE